MAITGVKNSIYFFGFTNAYYYVSDFDVDKSVISVGHNCRAM